LEQAIAALKTALNNGMTLWSGAEFYGTPEYNSMTLLKHYFTKYPEDADKVTLVIKGGMDLATYRYDGSPEGIRRSLDNIISQLGGTKKPDLFSCSRRDPTTPLEVTFGVIQKEYIDTGKLGGIALSECSADTIHEAAKIAKIGTVEVELSIFSPDILTNGVTAACAEHGIPITAYSPIGRGVSLTPRKHTPFVSSSLANVSNDSSSPVNSRTCQRSSTLASSPNSRDSKRPPSTTI
jgi:pyridoxine 4-dehydrogenase